MFDQEFLRKLNFEFITIGAFQSQRALERNGKLRQGRSSTYTSARNLAKGRARPAAGGRKPSGKRDEIGHFSKSVKILNLTSCEIGQLAAPAYLSKHALAS